MVAATWVVLPDEIFEMGYAWLRIRDCVGDGEDDRFELFGSNTEIWYSLRCNTI